MTTKISFVQRPRFVDCLVVFAEDVFERKESKKDKGYVAFRSDDDSVGEEEEEDSR